MEGCRERGRKERLLGRRREGGGQWGKSDRKRRGGWKVSLRWVPGRRGRGT